MTRWFLAQFLQKGLPYIIQKGGNSFNKFKSDVRTRGSFGHPEKGFCYGFCYCFWAGEKSTFDVLLFVLMIFNDVHLSVVSTSS